MPDVPLQRARRRKVNAEHINSLLQKWADDPLVHQVRMKTEATAKPLSVPDLGPDTDVLAAALAYAKAGWFVLPVREGSKNPGSVLGKGWPTKSTRDPQVIASWWAGTNHGIALHAGASGAVVLDVDHPEKLPEDLAEHLSSAPFQSTRKDSPERGHVLFAQPPGRRLGNSVGKLGDGWGEVRGSNGVIVVAPSQHEKAAEGGRYTWVRTGDLPVLPAAIAERLPDADGARDIASEGEVESFLDYCTGGEEHRKAQAILDRFAAEVEGGTGRHDAAIRAACWMAREAAAGFFPARPYLLQLGDAFVATFNEQELLGGRGRKEFERILAHAVGQLTSARIAEVTARHDTSGYDFGEDIDLRPPAPASATGEGGAVNPSDTGRKGGEVVDEFEKAVKGREWQILVNEEAKRRTASRGVETSAERKARIESSLLSSSELDNIPPQAWLVEDWIPAGGVSMLVGASGSYKSFVAVDLAARLALGRSWFGYETRGGPVIYVVAEGVPGLKKRIREVEAGMNAGCPVPELSIYPGSMQIGSDDWESLTSICEERKTGLVIVDTLNRSTRGIDENDNSQMRDVVEAAADLSRRSGASVLLVHHSGHVGGRARGASSVPGALDSIIAVKRSEDLRVTLSTKQDAGGKAKDTEEQSVHLKLCPGPLGDSLVVANLDGEDAPIPGSATDRAKDLVLAALRHYGQVQEKGKSPHGLTQAEAIAAIRKDSKDLVREVAGPGVSATTAKRAWHELVKDQVIRKIDSTSRFLIPADGS